MIKFKINKLFLPLGLAIVLCCFSYCSKTDAGVIKAPGVVDGTIITLKSVVAGTIQKLDLVEGEKIARDKVAVQINPDKIENQLEELDINSKGIDINSDKLTRKMRFVESDILYLKKQVERFRRLKEKNAMPGEKLESMELKLQEAEASLFDLKRSMDDLVVQKEKIRNKREYLRLLLNDHIVKSPVDGVVIEKFVSEGEQVLPGTAVADVLDISSLYVDIFIEENEMGKLKLNQEAGILVDGLKDKELKGKISFFGRKSEFSSKYIISEKERKSLLYEVKIKVQDPDGILKMGMPVSVVLR
jgi:HlyD family secretion protein